jgi:hypothetical protein
MPTNDGLIEYPLRVEVDGESFLIEHDLSQEGVYHYDWVSGPNSGYGFSTAFAVLDESTRKVSYDRQPTLAEHLDGIHDFLEQVDPDTGYIEDE